VCVWNSVVCGIMSGIVGHIAADGRVDSLDGQIIAKRN
jgi:hypothetical protein